MNCIVIGDMGKGTPGQFKVAKAMKQLYQKNRIQFVLGLGDNIYPNGCTSVHDKEFIDNYLTIGDVHKGIPYDKKFHLILSSHVIEHLYDAPQAIEHMCTHLVPGGFLFTQVPIQPEERFLNAKPHYYMFDNMKDYISLFDDTKFKVVHQEEGLKAANPEATLVLQKL